MKLLLLQNLGRIENAEMEIRPLAVLVGKNNTNKTWGAYALYGLLRHLTWRTSAIAGIRLMGTTLIKIQTDTVRKQVFEAVARAAARLPQLSPLLGFGFFKPPTIQALIVSSAGSPQNWGKAQVQFEKKWRFTPHLCRPAEAELRKYLK